MTYSTSNPPRLLVGCLAATGASLWTYSSTDVASAVDGSGYITNARDLGMKVGDVMFGLDTTTSPNVTSSFSVIAINANGSADLSNGITIGGGSNSD